MHPLVPNTEPHPGTYVYPPLFFPFRKEDLCLYLPGVSTPTAAHSGNGIKIHQQVIRPQAILGKFWWAKHAEPGIKGSVFSNSVIATHPA